MHSLLRRFRDVYARNAERRHVETPSCLEKVRAWRAVRLETCESYLLTHTPTGARLQQSVYKAISCQKELHSVDFRQEDITDPQLIALAETLLEMPMISYLDLRDNRITDDVRQCVSPAFACMNETSGTLTRLRWCS